MAKRKRQDQELEQIRIRREKRLAAQQRQRDYRFLLFGGVAGGVAALFVLIGLFLNFIYLPATTAIAVNGEKITTEDFRKRYRFERQAMLEQLEYYQSLQQQFSGQLNLQSEIVGLRSALSDAFSLGVRIKTLMIEDRLIAQAADQEGITVASAAIETYLAEEIAQRYAKLTPDQATATSTARQQHSAAATAVSELTPTPEVDPDATPTTVLSPTASLTPVDVLSAADMNQGREALTNDVRKAYDMSLEEYEAVIRARLLRERMTDHIGAAIVPTTEQQVWVQHILLTFNDETADDDTDRTSRTEEEALALAHALRERLAAGESFRYLVDLYSDDPSKTVNNGDLGWFGPGRMVPAFEAVAFDLAPNTYSDPVKTDFGYHIIEVLASNPEVPRAESDIIADIQAEFDTWLDALKAEAVVEESGRLTSQLPPGAEREIQEFLAEPAGP